MPKGNLPTNCPFLPYTQAIRSPAEQPGVGAIETGRRPRCLLAKIRPARTPANHHRRGPAWPGSRRARYPRALQTGRGAPVARHQSRASSRARRAARLPAETRWPAGCWPAAPFTVGADYHRQASAGSASPGHAGRGGTALGPPGRIAVSAVRQPGRTRSRGAALPAHPARTPGRRHHRDRAAAQDPQGAESGSGHPGPPSSTR